MNKDDKKPAADKTTRKAEKQSPLEKKILKDTGDDRFSPGEPKDYDAEKFSTD
jgi:hypothetical protein